MTPDQKGAIAETAVVAAAIQLGIPVATVITKEGYDLVFDVGGRMLRVQCKWAARSGDVIRIHCRTCRRGSDGFVRRAYARAEVDAIAAYCPDLARCFLIPAEMFDGRASYVQLRLGPTRNKQEARVNWADRFDFQSLDWGAIALGP